MQLTEQQKVELKRRGWQEDMRAAIVVRWSRFDSEHGYADIDLTDGEITSVSASYLPWVLEFAAILGIAPPGYRLVPEQVAREAAWLLCKVAEGDAPTHFDRTRAPQVAAALQGEGGIPTETLEAGVVVVPRDLVEEWLNAMRVNREARLSGKGDIGANQALLAYASQALEEAFTSALSRLEQNGGVNE